VTAAEDITQHVEHTWVHCVGIGRPRDLIRFPGTRFS
jgi:hypothetical protein